MPTSNLGLPLITGNMTADIVKDMNSLAEELDLKVASKKDVEDHATERASLKKVGHTQLSSALDSTDETMSATPLAIKKTNDKVDEQALNNREILRDLEYQRINYSNF